MSDMKTVTSVRENIDVRSDWIALALRAGIGLVFLIGGWNKLSQLIDPTRETAIVATYTSPHSYINAFFTNYLFTGTFGEWLTPWSFLTLLSTFELVSGLALIAGLLVRPLALTWGLLLWTFVMALPVVTAPGVEVDVNTYTSPAMLVQIRDIGLSGIAFVLFNLGSGAFSLDARLFGQAATTQPESWDNLGLVMRLSVALPILVGGTFAGLDHIQNFASTPWLLVPLGILLASGTRVRAAGVVVAAITLWVMWTKLSLDKSLIVNLNSVKREFAFLAAGIVLASVGGGVKFTLAQAGAKARQFLSA
ncbi:MAG: DoxX family protein [Pseudomonadota bacterium]